MHGLLNIWALFCFMYVCLSLCQYHTVLITVIFISISSFESFLYLLFSLMSYEPYYTLQGFHMMPMYYKVLPLQLAELNLLSFLCEPQELFCLIAFQQFFPLPYIWKISTLPVLLNISINLNNYQPLSLEIEYYLLVKKHQISCRSLLFVLFCRDNYFILFHGYL